MLSTQTTCEQINTWRAAKSETEHLEFKEAKNQFDFETLLECCVALANERGGILLLGIANKPPRPVVGTNAYLNITKTTEDLFKKLGFRVDIEEVQHPDGRVLVFHIPSRPIGHPYHLNGSYLMRSGEALVPMTQDQLKQIFKEGSPGKESPDRQTSSPRKVLVYLIVVLLLSGIGFILVKSRNGGYGRRAAETGPSKEGHATQDKVTATETLKQSEQRGDSGQNGDANSAIGKLSELGWQIQPGEGNRVQFSDIYKHISIRQSAPYFCALDKPFNVSIVGAKSLDGVDALRNAKHLIRFDLTAAEVNDLSELRYLHNLQILVMGQTAGHISDLSPLHDLNNLKELGLDSAAIRDLKAIQGLTNITKLSIGGTQVSDLSPIRNFRHLQSLNLGGAPVADLSPLADIDSLKEMQITGSEIASLSTFPRKENLEALSIHESRTVDLSPVGQLLGLEALSLFIDGPQGFDASVVRSLKKLTKLSISGNGFEYFSLVKGLDAIDELPRLRTLWIFGVQMIDLGFVADLQSLEEIAVTNAPLNNISTLSRIKTLKSVTLTGTSVVDISPLLNLSKLENLSIVHTPARSDVVTELERRGVKIQR